MIAPSLLSVPVPERSPERLVTLITPILLVQSPDKLRDSRRLLLACVHPMVEVADDPARVFGRGPGCSYHLIVLDLRDARTAERVAFYARRRWPRAKILLLGNNCVEFQDSLYDEIIDPCCDPVGFVEVSRRLLMSSVRSTQQLL